MSLGIYEDGVGLTERDLGFRLEGSLAATELRKLMTPLEAAHDFVTDNDRLITRKDDPFHDMYDIYHHGDNRQRFDEMRMMLHGLTAIIPSASRVLRQVGIRCVDEGVELHVLNAPASRNVTPDQQLELAFSVQSGESVIGDHKRNVDTGAEAGHVMTWGVASMDPDFYTRVENGTLCSFGEAGVNVAQKLNGSESQNQIFEESVDPTVFSYESWPKGARLLWPKGRRIASAALDRTGAIELAQGAVYLKLKAIGNLGVIRGIMESKLS